MFALFKKKSRPQTGAEMAEEGLQNIATAVQNGEVSLQQGRICDNIYVHADQPKGVPRLTYVMFSPTVKNQVIARCVILLDRSQDQIPIWQMDYAVLSQYRNQGFGLMIATNAALEFAAGMKGKLKNGYAIEAVVGEGNEASLKIARAILGGEEVLWDKATKANVHSFLKVYPA